MKTTLAIALLFLSLSTAANEDEDVCKKYITDSSMLPAEVAERSNYILAQIAFHLNTSIERLRQDRKGIPGLSMDESAYSVMGTCINDGAYTEAFIQYIFSSVE